MGQVTDLEFIVRVQILLMSPKRNSDFKINFSFQEDLLYKVSRHKMSLTGETTKLFKNAK